MTVKHVFIISLSFAAAAVSANPKVTHNLGPTYEILEPSIYVEFQALLEQKKASGELAKIEREGRKRAEESIRNPAPVEVRIARNKRSWTYDPSIVATNDVWDPSGNLIVRKGTTVNPLDQVSWKPMVFFDQRDPAQVRFAQRMLKEWGARGKPVLVGGSWIDLNKAWGRQVFFDQKGTLINRFAIQAVPAIVVQQGRVLLVSEIPTPGDR
jgi:conjugal transfer pilus assembly protein TraW